MKQHKLFGFGMSAVMLILCLIFSGCDTDKNSDTGNGNIIGKWQMYGSTQYGLEFTNYGILTATYYGGKSWGTMNYIYSGTTLTINGKNGTGILSNNGNTLTIAGFAEPGYDAGADVRIANGAYIRQ